MSAPRFFLVALGRAAASCVTLAVLLAKPPLAGRARFDLSPADQADRQRVLFIGNSLTAANDLPGMVRALSDALGGQAIDTATVAAGNFSLEDHWRDGAARRAIAQGGWTTVVLQQGPSALPESRQLLRAFTQRFAADIRRAGAQVALYMVWPSRDRRFDAAASSASYAAAARDVDGLLLRAGDAWYEAWRIDPSAPLYGPDGFHPSREGSYLAAIVIYEGLTGRSVAEVPRALPLAAGEAVTINEHLAALFRQSAQAVRQVR